MTGTDTGESFNSGARDEEFVREIFDTVLEVRTLYRDWRYSR